MFPLTELLAFWNAQRAASSPLIELFRNSYIHLHCTEVDELCDWIEEKRLEYQLWTWTSHCFLYDHFRCLFISVPRIDCRYFGLKIVRRETAGGYVTYRIVHEGILHHSPLFSFFNHY